METRRKNARFPYQRRRLHFDGMEGGNKRDGGGWLVFFFFLCYDLGPFYLSSFSVPHL